MHKRIFTLCLVLLTMGAVGTLKAENEKPFVIPELRHWQGGEGVVAVSNGTKVLYTDAELATAAEELAKDYGLLFGKGMKAKAVKASAKVPAGAIVMSLTTDEELGEEGYSIEIGESVVVKAQTPTGAYWATRTMLQVLEASNGESLPQGTVRD